MQGHPGMPAHLGGTWVPTKAGKYQGTISLTSHKGEAFEWISFLPLCRFLFQTLLVVF